MKLELDENSVAQIIYALKELANRRQEQAIDYHYNKMARHANLNEAAALRNLADNIESQKLEQ